MQIKRNENFGWPFDTLQSVLAGDRQDWRWYTLKGKAHNVRDLVH